MVSLVRALQSFQSGALSRDELLVEVDQMLEGGRADEAFLLEALEKENTKVPLPVDVHQQVQGKIEKAAEIRNKLNRETAAGEGEVDPDLSRTRLATSLFFNGTSSAGAGEAKGWSPETSAPAAESPRADVPERMKGTGDVLNDRFVLEECIGTGGMSSVYKALDRRKLEADDRNPYVAVKVLNVEFRAHPDSLIALQREAKKSQSLAHPNIVRVYDFDRDGATVYMTMEYLPGKSLAKLLRAPGFKGLPEKQSMEILEGISSALKFAHENGIIHADFKPANVILTDDGKVKVIDFGIARAFQRPDDTDMEATRFDPGSLGALTPTYASPEMLEHKEPDPRDDVYALACIAYEMFVGRHPFGRMQATEARDGGLELERRKHLTRRQWRALKTALDFDREKRTPGIEKFLSELRSERAVTLPAPVYTLGKVAVAAAIGVLAYQYLVVGFMQRSETDSPVAAAPAESSAGQSEMELASLQVQGIDLDADNAEPADSKEQGSAPAVGQRDEPEVLAMVDPEPVTPVKIPVPELSEAAVAGVLKEVKCAAFSTSVNDGVVNLRGYISRQFDINRLEKDLLALPGAKEVSSDLTRMDASKCAVIDLFAPYWAMGRGAGQGVSIKTRQEGNEFVEGDPLVVQISTPAYETYVNIDYFSLDGGVVHMVPGPRKMDNQAPANYKATIGDLGEWTIGGPFGSEMVTVLYTPQPLFDKVRDEYETRADYLAAIEQQLKRISKTSGSDKIVMDFVMLDTRPKSFLQKLRGKTASH